MTLREDIAADGQAAWFEADGLAQTVIYKVGGIGSGASVLALIALGGDQAEEEGYFLEKMTAILQAADVATPEEGDTIAVGADTWIVRSIQEGNGIHWKLNCTREERPALTKGWPGIRPPGS